MRNWSRLSRYELWNLTCYTFTFGELRYQTLGTFSLSFSLRENKGGRAKEMAERCRPGRGGLGKAITDPDSGGGGVMRAQVEELTMHLTKVLRGELRLYC